ncbi:hypothetical protein M0802_008221 [Mischocyttarus mexicanus]|nr:hypothetical protein M0802_008221 [Mischocyttarus mexicanus]
MGYYVIYWNSARAINWGHVALKTSLGMTQTCYYTKGPNRIRRAKRMIMRHRDNANVDKRITLSGIKVDNRIRLYLLARKLAIELAYYL